MRKGADKLNRTFCVVATLLLLLLTFVYLMPNGIYARYKTFVQSSDTAKVAPFAPSFELTDKIDDKKSIISYGNVDGTVGLPQDATFTIKNYTGDTVTAVDLNYSLVFYIPAATFAQTAMIQFLQEQEDETKEDEAKTVKPVTPLYKLSDFGEVENSGNKYTFTPTTETITTDENTYDGAPEIADEVLTPSGNVFTVTKKEGDAPAGTITVEMETIQTDYYLLFSLWEQGAYIPLAPTLKVNLSGEIPYLKITVSRPDFILEAGSKVEHNMILRLLPEKSMTEENEPIDSEIHESWKNLNGIEEKNLSIIDQPSGETWNVSYENEVVTVKQTTKNNVTTTWSTAENADTKLTIGYEQPTDGDGDGATNTGACGKGYPSRLNAIFEQVAPSGS